MPLAMAAPPPRAGARGRARTTDSRGESVPACKSWNQSLSPIPSLAASAGGRRKLLDAAFQDQTPPFVMGQRRSANIERYGAASHD